MHTQLGSVVEQLTPAELSQQIGLGFVQWSTHVTELAPVQVHVPAGEQLLQGVLGVPASDEQPPQPFAPAFALEHVTLCLSAEQVQVPPLHVPHDVFGWFVSVAHPPQALAPAFALEHVTLCLSAEQVQVPPLHVPHDVFGWFASVEHPLQALTPASPLLQVTLLAPEHVYEPPPQVPHAVFG
jgi:hypothetical protein